MKPSKHVVEDRIDRLTAILSDEYLSDFTPFAQAYRNGHREILTVNGVLLIKAKKKDLLITAYVATPMKVSAIFHSLGQDVPKAYFRKVWKNLDKYKKLIYEERNQ